MVALLTKRTKADRGIPTRLTRPFFEGNEHIISRRLKGYRPTVVIVVPPFVCLFVSCRSCCCWRRCRRCCCCCLCHQVFGMDTFYVTATEKSPFATLYKGNMRGKSTEEVSWRIFFSWNSYSNSAVGCSARYMVAQHCFCGMTSVVLCCVGSDRFIWGRMECSRQRKRSKFRYFFPLNTFDFYLVSSIQISHPPNQSLRPFNQLYDPFIPFCLRVRRRTEQNKTTI